MSDIPDIDSEEVKAELRLVPRRVAEATGGTGANIPGQEGQTRREWAQRVTTLVGVHEELVRVIKIAGDEHSPVMVGFTWYDFARPVEKALGDKGKVDLLLMRAIRAELAARLEATRGELRALGVMDERGEWL